MNSFLINKFVFGLMLETPNSELITLNFILADA
jgi:hypothetical protein